MACPLESYPPQIPENVCFSYNLIQYEAALRPFLSTLPIRYVFEPLELRNLFLEEGYAEGMQLFRRSIEIATSVKEQGNEAFANKDRIAAVALYEAAAEDVEKLLLKGMSHEEDRNAKQRRFWPCVGQIVPPRECWRSQDTSGIWRARKLMRKVR